MKTNTKTAATKTVTATPKTEAATKPATVTVAPRLGKAGIAVLTAIAKGPLTRAEISLATGIKSGFCSLLGHVDPAKTEPSSLSHKGFLTVGTTEGKSASTYTITDAGKAALKAATTPATNPEPKTEAKPAAAAKKPAAKAK